MVITGIYAKYVHLNNIQTQNIHIYVRVCYALIRNEFKIIETIANSPRQTQNLN